MKTLISGASGFLGPYILKEFDQDVSTISLRDNEWRTKSLSNFNTVIHLAGKAHAMNIEDESEYYSINTQLTYNFASKCKLEGVSHFIFISTIKVYGEGGDSIINENTNANPQDAYAQSKLDAEVLLNTLGGANFFVTIVRPPLIYGKGVKGNLSKIIRFCRIFPIIPLDRIKNKRSMVYAGNVASMIKKIKNLKASGIYIPLDKSSYSTTSLANEICRNIEKNRFLIRPFFMEELIKIFKPKLHRRLFGDFVVTNNESLEKLNWTPPYAFSFGVSEMLQDSL